MRDDVHISYRWCEWGCVGLAVFFMAAFVGVAAFTLGYPFPLEWKEGLIIGAVERVRDMRAIYVEPSLAYVPMITPPLYYYIAAFFSLFTGADFLIGRLISVLSALGCGYILYRWVHRHTRRWEYGMISAGVFFSTTLLSGRWSEFARTETLSLLFLLCGLYLFFHHENRKRAHPIVLCFLAAVLTCQASLLVILALLAAWYHIDREQALQVGKPFIAALAGVVLWFEITSAGWFGFYVFTVPAHYALGESDVLGFLYHVVPLFASVLFAAVFFHMLWQRDTLTLIRYAALTVSLVVASYALRLQEASEPYTLFYMHVAAALLTGVALPVVAAASHIPNRYIALVLLVMQFASLAYNPLPLIPSAMNYATGDRFLRAIGDIEGEIFMPQLAFVQTRVGKPSYDFGAAADLLRAWPNGSHAVLAQLQEELSKAVESQRFAAILPSKDFPLPELENTYVLRRNFNKKGQYLSGSFHFPWQIYVPRDDRRIQ